MPFTILNDPTAAINPATLTSQARPDKVDLDILVAALGGAGVVSGCAVTPDNSGASLNVDVAAGVVQVGNLSVKVAAATNVAVAAASVTFPRRDLVTVAYPSGVVSVTSGVAGAIPDLPVVAGLNASPPTAIALAVVDVPALATSITASNITDKRVILPSYRPSTGSIVPAVVCDSFIQNVSTVTNVGTAVTVGIPSVAGMTVGQTVVIEDVTGFTTNNPNGSFTVTAVNSGANTFGYTAGSAPTGSYGSGGTVQLVGTDNTAALNNYFSSGGLNLIDGQLPSASGFFCGVLGEVQVYAGQTLCGSNKVFQSSSNNRQTGAQLCALPGFTGRAVVVLGTGGGANDIGAGIRNLNVDAGKTSDVTSANRCAPVAVLANGQNNEINNCGITNGFVAALDTGAGTAGKIGTIDNCMIANGDSAGNAALSRTVTTNGTRTVTVIGTIAATDVGMQIVSTGAGITLAGCSRIASVNVGGGTYTLSSDSPVPGSGTSQAATLTGGFALRINATDWNLTNIRKGKGVGVMNGGGAAVVGGHWTHGGSNSVIGPNIDLYANTTWAGTFVDSANTDGSIRHNNNAGMSVFGLCRVFMGSGGSNAAIPVVNELDASGSSVILIGMILNYTSGQKYNHFIDFPNAYTEVIGCSIDANFLSGNIYQSGKPGVQIGLISAGVRQGDITSSAGLNVVEGANAKQGTTTLVGGTKVVANTSVTANSRIFLTVQSLGTVAAPKAIAVTATTPGTNFTITSADNTDTSVVAFEIFEPG